MKKLTLLLCAVCSGGMLHLNAQAPVFTNATRTLQPGFAGDDYTRDVKQISNNEYVVVGSQQNTAALGGLNGYLNYYNNAGVLQRSITFVGIGADDVWGVDAVINSPTSSDIYVTGFFTGSMGISLNIPASPSLFIGTWTAPSGIASDVTYFIAKFNQAGGLQWLYRAGTAVSAREEGRDITVQQVGATRLVYTTGLFRGTTAFLGATPAVGAVSTGIGDDGFVAAYTDNGATANINWVTRISGTAVGGNDIGQALDADALGNVYVTGGYKGASANFTSVLPAPGIGTSVSYGNDDAFVVSYSPAGAALAAAGYGGSAVGPVTPSPVEQGRGIAVNSTNDLLYVSGYYIGYTAPNTGSFGGAAFSGGYEGFVVAMKTTTLLPGFFRTIRTAGNDFCYKMDIDPTNDNIVVVPGSFTGVSGFVFNEANALVYTQPGCGGTTEGFVLRNDAFTGNTVLGTVCGGGTDGVVAVDVIPNFSYVCGHSQSATISFEGSLTSVTNAGAPNWDGFSATCNHYSIIRTGQLLSPEIKATNIYPNPAQHQFTLQLAEVSDENPALLVLLDLSGRAVLSESITQTQTEISVSQLPAGVYFWRITEQNGAIHQDKLIIAD
ncbi:MAG: T9SS type A sorting domain-containing protein [Bacteroidia bacterium]